MRNIRCRCCRLSMTFADSDHTNLYYATIKLTLYSITIFFHTIISICSEIYSGRWATVYD